MIRKFVLPLLALIGFSFAAWTVAQGSKPTPAAEPVVSPARAPYASVIAGAGIVEASTENIAIGTGIPGIVVEIAVRVGSRVKAGDPLFRIDDRDRQAELLVRQSALQTARDRLLRLETLPRPEDVPPVEARLREAESTTADLRDQLRMWESVTDRRAVSEDELSRRRYAVQTAEARVAQVNAELQQLKAGAWAPDVAIARAEVAAAEAQVRATEIEIDRLVVRAPFDGDVLQLNVRAGEFAQAGALQTPLMLLGNIERLHVRVDVDENDAWRFTKEGRAHASLRGNRDLSTDLAFVRVEPFVVPKRSLTGESTERVDTRVMQVIYGFDASKLPVLVGQQMDVFIESAPSAGAGTSGTKG